MDNRAARPRRGPISFRRHVMNRIVKSAPPLAVLIAALGLCSVGHAADPLPSWNDGAAKQSIVKFVDGVTREGSPDFVPVPERIATFDNDGTLWSEQPIYVQVFFIADRVKALAPQHPEWETQEPFASVLKGNPRGITAGGEAGVAALLTATHSGMTTDEFSRLVGDWIATAKHPKTGQPFTAMVYKPMLELLDYLRANGFKTYVVSGGGIEFMRPWTEKVYGIPPEQVIGTTGGLKFDMKGGKPALTKLPNVVLNDDKEGKPVGIQRHVGRRPIAAFGNSDGDLQMLQWACYSPGLRLCLYVHHTDGEREWAYDRDSHIGRLDKGLDEAKLRGWTVVSIKDDWNKVFAFE